jgi:hypothetical protein
MRLLARMVRVPWCFIAHPWRWWKVMQSGGNSKTWWCRVCGEEWTFRIPMRRTEVSDARIHAFANKGSLR